MLRNVVEKTFGAWKKRFPILSHALEYDIDCQRDLVFALAVVHNFIIDHDGINGDEILGRATKGSDDADLASLGNEDTKHYIEVQSGQQSSREKRELKEWRDNIAEEMWRQYQEVTAGNSVNAQVRRGRRGQSSRH